LAFAGVYWAGIPRRSVARGYTIEESEAWAKTVAGRIRLCCDCDDDATGGTLAPEGGLSRSEYQTVRVVFDEMIEGISVLERLMFLAEKAGVLKFDLGRVLTGYVNRRAGRIGV
jgi:hypothetical protein